MSFIHFDEDDGRINNEEHIEEINHLNNVIERLTDRVAELEKENAALFIENVNILQENNILRNKHKE